MDYIPREKLIVGARYKLHARNFQEGVWNGKAFEGIRTKFGHRFLDEELHWDEDPHFGTAKPLELMEGEPERPQAPP